MVAEPARNMASDTVTIPVPHLGESLVSTLKRLSVIGLATTLITSLAFASPAQAGVDNPLMPSMFGRIFPAEPLFNTQTNQELADLAQIQLDPNADADNNPTGLMSGFTYFGQFVDHDLTRDISPSPTARIDVTTIPNNRTYKFDLDSVYGGGPSVSPQLYAADGLHFLVQNPSPNGVVDLPRNPDGSAILVEPRNDENQIISQIHTAFLLFHNAQVDRGLTFAMAQANTIAAYQTVVLTEFLPHIVGQATINSLLAKDATRFFDPGKKKEPMTPIEFSVGVYRFGHSQVRLAYRLNGTNNCQNLQVFSLTAPDASLMGGRPLQAGRQIAWGQFLPDLPQPPECAALQVIAPASNRNVSRKIDTLLSASLFRLPIPGAEATGSNVLAFRNLIRAKFYDMPSGESIARQMGLPVVHVTLPPPLDVAFANGTPLWYYILAEAGMTQNGARLGPVGATLVADCFLYVMQLDKESILNKPPVTPPVNTLADILITAGLASR
jgi:hypothetical protein